MLKRKNSSGGIADVDEKKSIVVGYASKFGNVDSYGDIVAKGAFKRTIDHNGSRVKTLMHHDPVQIVGKPIEMREDDQGLYTETKISDTAMGRDLLTLLADGVLDEMSIGYIPVKEGYDEKREANILSEVKLVEYSFVTMAANPEARVEGFKGIASVNEITSSMKRLEKALRDGSFVTDEVPEAIEFIVKYWRSVLEDTKSDLEVVPSDDSVEFEAQNGDSPEGTRQDPTDSPEKGTQEGILGMLKDWQAEVEVLSAIHLLGSDLKGNRK